MEVVSAVRFPKIFSPRVLIRDSSRVNDFDPKPPGVEPRGLTLSVQCWEKPYTPTCCSRFSSLLDQRARDPVHEQDYVTTSPRLGEGTVREREHHGSRRPAWPWISERPQDLSMSGSPRHFVSGFYDSRGADSSPSLDDSPRGMSPDSVKSGGRFKSKMKIFKCPYCVISCSNRGQLLGHIRIHTGERPFVCQEPGCKKSFIRNEELTRHRRIHTGERPYVCDSCKKAFTRKDHLNKHVKIHSTTNAIFTV
ncbi:early growth response protein 2-like [Haliotis rubra]|uniref:early growth response protein 2-like n=1 Tax=Haliotis rubra TaxID=36100 RepID=UPI001EE4F8FE|nr:early growth response protein 2-like [Haliotis rubra]